jgi:hypothetical protein
MHDRFPIARYVSPQGFVFMTDITTNIRVTDAVKKEGAYPLNITVGDGDRPEIYSDKLYGDSKFHWLLLHLNGAVNPYYDWLLPSSSFDNFVDEKYPGYTLFLTDITGEKPFVGSFRRNDIVFKTTQTNPDLQPEYYGSFQNARVVSFDPAMCRLVMNFTEKTLWVPQEGDYISGKNTDALGEETYYVARIGKAIESQFAMHHFENDGEILNPLLPLSKQGQYIESTDIMTGFTFGATLLGRYIKEDLTDYAVTNREYEVDVNDEKRNITAITRGYLEKVSTQVERSLSNG